MSVDYRLIAAHELDTGLVAAWRSIQEREPRFESPYFCPEFTRAVGTVRDDVRVVVIENDGQPAGFFPHQRAAWGRGSPVGGPLSDYHGVIAAPEAEWSVVEMMRAARLSVWTFDHLVDTTGRFAPYVTASAAASPQIDLASFQPPPDFARKARKLAREVGELSFSLHDASAAALERMFEWKSEQYRRTGAAIVRPTRGSEHGHPVFIDRTLFAQLRGADPRAGAKPVIRANATAAGDFTVDDAGAFLDIDTPEDYARVLTDRQAGEASPEPPSEKR